MSSDKTSFYFLDLRILAGAKAVGISPNAAMAANKGELRCFMKMEYFLCDKPPLCLYNRGNTCKPH